LNSEQMSENQIIALCSILNFRNMNFGKSLKIVEKSNKWKICEESVCLWVLYQTMFLHFQLGPWFGQNLQICQQRSDQPILGHFLYQLVLHWIESLHMDLVQYQRSVNHDLDMDQGLVCIKTTF
jgi:hypothetical protein